MKNLIMICLAIFAITTIANAQIPGKFFGVLEIKHASNVDADINAPDPKTIELNSIVRYMFSKNIGGSAVIRINDTTSNALGGITFLPVEWYRIDILGGVSIQNTEKKSLLGLRVWFGNKSQDFWFNCDGGTQDFWFEVIYLIKIAPWFALGGMADKKGFGPRVELSPIGPFVKIWGGITADWRNKNRRLGHEGYKAESLFAHVGVKAIF